jgi:hypothetical protein
MRKQPAKVGGGTSRGVRDQTYRTDRETEARILRSNVAVLRKNHVSLERVSRMLRVDLAVVRQIDTEMHSSQDQEGAS